MPTSVSNYNFLVPLVTEIWRGSQNKTGSADLLRRPLADQFLHVAIVPAYAYQRTKFHLSRSIIFGDIRGGQNKMWELLIPPDAPWWTNFYTGR